MSERMSERLNPFHTITGDIHTTNESHEEIYIHLTSLHLSLRLVVVVLESLYLTRASNLNCSPNRHSQLKHRLDRLNRNRDQLTANQIILAVIALYFIS